ncbi:MAG: response regulator [Bacteroidota bacterium]
MNKVRILIVEDEVLISDMISRYLRKNGYEIAGQAISYEEAIDLYHQERPDLVLLDIRLNGPKTGIDVARYLQALPDACPYIYLTSQVDSLHIEQAKQTLPAGYLTKPIQKASLYATIEIAMFQQQANQEEERSIQLTDGGQHHQVAIKNILFLQAEHVYVQVHISGQKPILQRGSLKDMLDQLPESIFLQTHRSYAINRHQVNRWDAQAVYIGKQAIPISRSRKKMVQAALE